MPSNKYNIPPSHKGRCGANIPLRGANRSHVAGAQSHVRLSTATFARFWIEEEEKEKEERRIQSLIILFGNVQSSLLITDAIVRSAGTAAASRFICTCISARCACAYHMVQPFAKRFSLKPMIRAKIKQAADKGNADLTFAAMSYLQQNKVGLWNHSVLAAIIRQLAVARSRKIAMQAAMLYLDDDDRCVRWQALSLIGEHSDAAEYSAEVTAAVAACYQDSEQCVREKAVMMLHKIAPSNYLAAAAVADDESVHTVAIKALRFLVGQRRSCVMACLLSYLQDWDANVRMRTAVALQYVCGHGEKCNLAAVTAITNCLDDEVAYVRKSLVESLGSIAEKDDEQAKSALRRVLENRKEDEHVQSAAIAALCRIARPGDLASLSVVERFLEHETLILMQAAEKACRALTA